eukprot:COSAG01_NODE_178_length_22933_cov_18.398529_22_plen_178_part_00
MCQFGGPHPDVNKSSKKRKRWGLSGRDCQGKPKVRQQAVETYSTTDTAKAESMVRLQQHFCDHGTAPSAYDADATTQQLGKLWQRCTSRSRRSHAELFAAACEQCEPMQRAWEAKRSNTKLDTAESMERLKHGLRYCTFGINGDCLQAGCLGCGAAAMCSGCRSRCWLHQSSLPPPS